MVVPHSEESTFSLRLPLFAVKLIVAFLVLFVTGVCVLGFAYIRAVADAKEVQTLRQANRAQQEEIDALAVETQRMMEQVREIDELIEVVTERIEGEEGEIKGINEQSTSATILEQDTIMYDNGRSYSSRSLSNGVLERASSNILLLQNIIPEQTELLDSMEDYVTRMEATPSIWPARGRISSGFGMRPIPYSASGYQFHTGVDIIGARGTAIWATAAGEVIFTGYQGSYGNIVIIEHGYGYETLYAHLAGFSVNAGEYVEKGQNIGYMGSSGRTTGTHLHYEVHYNGSFVNPQNYMKQ
ncbi:MAG: M23 family metallopeptidase [Bacillota bacterium]|nr:M23 family metallopeptidase [Bacillota bacterium]